MHGERFQTSAFILMCAMGKNSWGAFNKKAEKMDLGNNKIMRRKSQVKSWKNLVIAGVTAAALGAAGVGFAQAPRLMAPPVAADGTLSFADLVERVSPSVVSVLVEREVESPRVPDQFEEFFRFRFGEPDSEDQFDDGSRRMQAEGSGFFVDSEGHIVTNNHVVDGADSVRVPSYGRR